MLPSLSALKTTPVGMPGEQKRQRRTLPNFTIPPTKRQERDGWEAPPDNKLNAADQAMFRASMANLDNFDGSIQVDWRMTEDGPGGLEEIIWDVATDVHKRAFGQVLRLWHKHTAKMSSKSSTLEAEEYTPDEWFEVFDQRRGWHVEIERIEYDEREEGEEGEEGLWFTERLTLTRDDS